MTRIFAFDPEEYREIYARLGWVHIKGGIAPEFLAVLQDFVDQRLATTKLDGFAIKGKKEQSLFEFPADTNFPDEIFDAIATVCGLRRETMTLSERHIQAYDADADPEPVAHKDRFPSQVSVGFSVRIPRDSRLVLYPHEHRELNPFNKAAALNHNLQPHQRPEVVLPDAREVELDDEDGDVVMFPGSTTWHLRRRAAGAINLYVKLNDFDCDPLGEDPSTVRRRERTLALLANGGAERLGARVPARSRRLDSVSRRYAPGAWHETLHAQLYGDEPFGLTQVQLELLRAADGRRTLDELIASVSANSNRSGTRAEALVLLERGALDLLG
jgi:hypothetical protein